MQPDPGGTSFKLPPDLGGTFSTQPDPGGTTFKLRPDLGGTILNTQILSYRKVRALLKAAGLRANGKGEVLREELIAHRGGSTSEDAHAENQTDLNPEQTSLVRARTAGTRAP